MLLICCMDVFMVRFDCNNFVLFRNLNKEVLVLKRYDIHHKETKKARDEALQVTRKIPHLGGIGRAF